MEAQGLPRTDPILTHFALCPACGSEFIDEVLFVCQHVHEDHGWDRTRVQAWVEGLRAGRVK